MKIELNKIKIRDLFKGYVHNEEDNSITKNKTGFVQNAEIILKLMKWKAAILFRGVKALIQQMITCKCYAKNATEQKATTKLIRILIY